MHYKKKNNCQGLHSRLSLGMFPDEPFVTWDGVITSQYANLLNSTGMRTGCSRGQAPSLNIQYPWDLLQAVPLVQGWLCSLPCDCKVKEDSLYVWGRLNGGWSWSRGIERRERWNHFEPLSRMKCISQLCSVLTSGFWSPPSSCEWTVRWVLLSLSSVSRVPGLQGPHGHAEKGVGSVCMSECYCSPRPTCSRVAVPALGTACLAGWSGPAQPF